LDSSDLKYILGDDGKRAFYDTVACVHELIYSARESQDLHAQLNKTS